MILKTICISKKKSTSHAIISLIEKIQDSVNEKQIICEASIDLEKAIYTTDHTLLLNKLPYYGLEV